MHLTEFGPPTGFAAKRPAKQRDRDHVEMHAVEAGFEGTFGGGGCAPSFDEQENRGV